MQQLQSLKPYCKYRRIKFENKDKKTIAYLCVLLDVKTTEVISYALSQTMTKELALGTIESGIEKIKRNKYSTIIHSDRGSQFTSKDYRDLLLEHGLTQSMSAPASPRDNAVIESFFGHLKDEICLKGLKTFEQVIQVIDDYMYYYNNERRQWNKSKMTPVEYRKFLLASYLSTFWGTVHCMWSLLYMSSN